MAAPGSAAASLFGDRIEVSMYGRAGVAWSPSGQLITGRSMNLTGGAIGGRFEEGDYLEPTIKFHILKPEEKDKPYAHAVVTPALFSKNGSFIGAFANGFDQTLGGELFQAYLEAGNVLAPDLKFWAGARFYRGGDVHIADYFYFNNLSGQGGGVKWGGLDVAVLLQTSGQGANNNLYNWDADGDGDLDLRRQRTILVGQYIYNIGEHHLHGLVEVHYTPAGRGIAGAVEGTDVLPTDFGWVAGIKGHLTLPGGGFNDLSVKYGSGIANGAVGGSQTWNTFGLPNSRGTFGGGSGLEVVDHFLYNFGPKFSLNAYGILHWGSGASGLSSDTATDFAVGARGFLYLTDFFHLIGEGTFQGLKRGTQPFGLATKFSIVPTIVPTGEHSVWARPHIRLIYTLAVYNGWARNLYPSPYLQVEGVSPLGHFIGARTEWWF